MDDSVEDRTEGVNWSPTVPARYANEATISTNVFDFVFTFRMKTLETTEDVAVLHMSPQHAMSVLLLLQRQLREYEKQVGPISLPDELRARLTGEAPTEDGRSVS